MYNPAAGSPGRNLKLGIARYSGTPYTAGMDEPLSIESLLLDPELACFSLRPGIEGRGSRLRWVLEAAVPDDASEALAGDIVVAGAPADEEAARNLASLAVKAGAAALAMPEGCSEESGALPLVTFPAWMPRHAAAGRLAHALWPSISAGMPVPDSESACYGRTAADRRPIDPAASISLRVLALSAGDPTTALDRYLPVGADTRHMPRGPAGEAYLLLRVADRVSPAELRGSLRAAAQDACMTIGVSGRFAPGADPAEHVPKAREAATLGMALFGAGHVSFYDNLYLYKAFIDDGRPDLLLTFSRETLNRLRDWDECHGSELLKTLETFFELDRSVSRTAERLGIHRHTLKQRLGRIEEATSCPIRGEGAMRYELILAYKHLSKIKL